MKSSLARSILSTLSYHSRFSYPLTLPELHRFLLINRPLSSNEVGKTLKNLVDSKNIINQNNYYSLPSSFGLRPSAFVIRLRRRQTSAPKLRLARRAARLIGLLPSVKLVCLTGALAMENSDENDDIDLMIVTTQNRLWLTRPLVVFLISLFFKRRRHSVFSIQYSVFSIQHSVLKDALCLNLWLDTSALAMPPHRRDLRTAHELAQMKPLVNKDHTYERMMLKNKWGRKYLANVWEKDKWINGQVDKQTNRQADNHFVYLFRLFIHLSYLSNYLFISLFIFLNKFLFFLQYLYMKPKLTSEEVDLHAAFFHPKARKNPPVP